MAGLLIVAGLAARFYGLGINSFWYDELISVTSADPERSFVSLILNVPSNEIQPPLYTVLLWLWRHLAGDSEIAIRLLSATVGTVTVAVAYSGGRRVMRAPGARFFTLLTACSFGAIVYSQEARPYSLLILFGTVLALVTLRGFFELSSDRGLTGWTFGALVVTSLLAAHTHYFGLLYSAATHAALLLHAALRRRSICAVLGSGVATLLLSLPWLAYELPRKSHFVGSFWAPTSPGWILRQMEVLFTYAMGAAAPVLFGLIALRLFRLWRTVGSRDAILSPFAGLLASLFILCGIVGVISTHTSLTVARYFLVAVPALLLVAAWALSDLEFQQSNRLRDALAVVCGVFMLLPLVGYYAPYKQQYREAAAHLASSPGCYGASVLAWRFPGWAANGLTEFRYYVPEESGVRLVSTDSASVSEFQRPRDCAVFLWVAHPTVDAGHPRRLMRELGLDPASVSVVMFNGTYLLEWR